MGNIVNEHVKGSTPGAKVKLISYFRARKLSTMFYARVKDNGIYQVSCVYHFTCPIVSCKVTYIAHTTYKVKTCAQ